MALYYVADPYLVTLGLVPEDEHDDIIRAEYEAYARNAIVQLRRVREGTQLEEDHMRNRQAIVHWLMAHTRAIEIRARGDKTFYVMVDPVAFRAGVAELLAEVQRIKSDGDYTAARTLFETYGVHFDAALRDEVVARVDRLKIPSYTGFVMPKLEAVVERDRRRDGRHHLVSHGSDETDARVFRSTRAQRTDIRRRHRERRNRRVRALVAGSGFVRQFSDGWSQFEMPTRVVRRRPGDATIPRRRERAFHDPDAIVASLLDDNGVRGRVGRRPPPPLRPLARTPPPSAPPPSPWPTPRWRRSAAAT